MHAQPAQPGRRRKQLFRVGLAVMVTVLALTAMAAIPQMPLYKLLHPSAPRQNYDIGLGITVSGDAVPTGLAASIAKPEVQAMMPDTKDPKTGKESPYVTTLPVVEIGPSGKLAAPMTVTMPLPQPLGPDGTPLVITSPAQESPDWTALNATVTPDRQHVTFTVDHLSWFGLDILWSAGKQLLSDAFDTVTADFYKKVAQPKCPQESQARTQGYAIKAQYTVASTLLWCMGYRSDTKDRIVTIANNQTYPLQLDLQKLGVIDSGPVLFSFEEIWRLNHVVIMPKSVMTLQVNPLEPKETATLATSSSAQTVALGVVNLVAQVFLAIYAKFFSGSAQKALDALTPVPECTAMIAQLDPDQEVNPFDVIKACFGEDSLKKMFGSVAGALLTPVALNFSAAKVARTTLTAIDDHRNKRDQYKLAVSRSAIDPAYVGDWTRHVSGITIKSDGTAEMLLGAYNFCGPAEGNTCEFHANLTMEPQSDGTLRATFQKVWYTTGETTPATPSAAEVAEFPQMGEHRIYSLDGNNHRLFEKSLRPASPSELPDPFGLPPQTLAYCNSSTPVSLQAPCGA